MEVLKPGDPTKIGPYAVKGVIGRGGMGIVYCCTSGGTTVAVKVINPSLNYDLEARRRFRREIAAAKRVNGGSVAKVINEGSDQGMLWYASEFVEGMTLQQAVTLERFKDEALFNFVRGMCKSLREIHSSGIVHRDLKPTNIMVGPRGVVVLDFGISHIVGGTAITATGEVIGTANYMSPEHFGIGEIGPASDIFALGSVLAFAVTGRSAFGNHQTLATAMRAILDDQPDLRGIAEPVRKIIELCLQKDPAKRVTIDQIEALLPAAKTVVLGNAEWLPLTVRQQVLAPTKVYPKPKTRRVASRRASVALVGGNASASGPQAGRKAQGRASIPPREDSIPAPKAKNGNTAVKVVAVLALVACFLWFAFKASGWYWQSVASLTVSSLPKTEFTSSAPGSQLALGSGQTIVVEQAKALGYNLLLEVTFRGYDVTSATKAANSLCTGIVYGDEEDILKSKGHIPPSSSATDMNNGKILADVVFDGALLITGNIHLSDSCDNFTHPLQTPTVGTSGYLGSQTISMLVNQNIVVPVLLVKDDMFVVPSGAGKYYYKVGSEGEYSILTPEKLGSDRKGDMAFDVYSVSGEDVQPLMICLKGEADADAAASCAAAKAYSIQYTKE